LRLVSRLPRATISEQAAIRKSGIARAAFRQAAALSKGPGAEQHVTEGYAQRPIFLVAESNLETTPIKTPKTPFAAPAVNPFCISVASTAGLAESSGVLAGP